MAYQNRYLYTAISPNDGEIFNMIGFSDASKIETNIFLDNLILAYPNNHIIVIWDNAPFHKPKIFKQKNNLSIIFLPPYGQELNPVERFFGEMRKATANKTFDDIEKIENVLNDEIIVWQNDKNRVIELTFWEWIKIQFKDICLLF